MKKKRMYDDQIKFNIFSFLSTLARALIETFVSLYLFKNGFSIKEIVMFYIIVYFISIPLAYLFVYIGEKIKYTVIMIIGFIGFILVQILLWNIKTTVSYIFLIALMYAIYRRGYWVARRFYITKIMPKKETSGLFSIVLFGSQVATIIASYLGANIFENLNLQVLTSISAVILLISIMPLFFIEYEKKESVKIELLKNIKKVPKKNLFAFSFYELNNITSFLFPIYIAIYIKDSYTLAGGLNIVNNIAVILFILIYGKIINKNKNYLVISSLLLIGCVFMKLSINTYIISIVYFLEGFISKMQNQSINKVYLEERNIDSTNYNLIYQVTECFIRALVMVPLLFINNIKSMIIVTEIAIFLLLMVYIIMNIKTSKKLKG